MFFLESSLLAPCSHCPPSSSTSHSPEARNGESAFDTSLMFVLKRRPLPFRLCLFCSLPHFHSFIAHLRMAGAGVVLRARILALTSTVSVRRDVSFSFHSAVSLAATNGRVGNAFRFRPRGAGRTGIRGWFHTEKASCGSSSALQGGERAMGDLRSWANPTRIFVDIVLGKWVATHCGPIPSLLRPSGGAH